MEWPRHAAMAANESNCSSLPQSLSLHLENSRCAHDHDFMSHERTDRSAFTVAARPLLRLTPTQSLSLSATEHRTDGTVIYCLQHSAAVRFGALQSPSRVLPRFREWTCEMFS